MLLSCRGLQAFRVFEMSDERGPDLHQKGLQFGICGARNQCLVERIDDLLVIRDFAVDVRPVEGSAFEGLKVSCVLFTVSLETLACRVVLWRHLELSREVRRGL